MKIENEDILASAISEEIESETATDAMATAREVVITVATFEATTEGPGIDDDECEDESEDEPDEETEPGGPEEERED